MTNAPVPTTQYTRTIFHDFARSTSAYDLVEWYAPALDVTLNFEFGRQGYHAAEKPQIAAWRGRENLDYQAPPLPANPNHFDRIAQRQAARDICDGPELTADQAATLMALVEAEEAVNKARSSLTTGLAGAFRTTIGTRKAKD